MHNRAVGGAPGSRHVVGDAVDLDLAGMRDAERAELARKLVAAGVTRFGTYTDSPNMLHIDTSREQGPLWLMHDRSNRNIAGAPQWLRELEGGGMIDTSGLAQFSPRAYAESVVPSSGQAGAAMIPMPDFAPMPTPSQAVPDPMQQLAANPFFNIGTSLLSAALSGRDFGSALQSGVMGSLGARLAIVRAGAERESRDYDRWAADRRFALDRWRAERQSGLEEWKAEQAAMPRPEIPLDKMRLYEEVLDLEKRGLVPPGKALEQLSRGGITVNTGDAKEPLPAPPGKNSRWIKFGENYMTEGPEGVQEIRWLEGTPGRVKQLEMQNTPIVLNENLDKLETLVKKHGITIMPSKAKGEMQSLYGEITGGYSRMKGFGSFDEGVARLVGMILGNPAGWNFSDPKTQEMILAQIKTFRNMANREAFILGKYKLMPKAVLDKLKEKYDFSGYESIVAGPSAQEDSGGPGPGFGPVPSPVPSPAPSVNPPRVETAREKFERISREREAQRGSR